MTGEKTLNTMQVVESAIISAPPDIVYGIIADYRSGHPSILPGKYFTGLELVEGGSGAGTVIDVRMSVMGVKAHYTMLVSEPEPGRVLQEEDGKAGVLTTFTVDAEQEGRQSRVTIETTMPLSGGLKGWIEKKINPSIMQKIYREELELLSLVARDRSS